MSDMNRICITGRVGADAETRFLQNGDAVVNVRVAVSGWKKDADATNVVEMNASDGSMNDMTVVESATLDQAGAAAGNGATAENASNAM